jgi:hypothetical protein
MADSIIEAVLPCAYTIPNPTPGTTIDLRRVSVSLRAPGTEEIIPYVESGERCDGALGGWHYDDPVSAGAIVMCAASCARMRVTPNSEFLITHGCPTLATPNCN